jgi:ESCRT-II complex subunit VPS22
VFLLPILILVGHSRISKKAEEIKKVSIESAVETVEKLQIKLAEFAKNHRTEIQNDPAFRQKFLQMCGPLGVDPLVSPKSFWAKALGVGMGDFYYELAVKIAEVCYATRTRNGGIIAMLEVYETLNRKKKIYSMADIPIAIKKLAILGGGFRVVKVGKSDMIVSVPTELDQDHMEVMSLAQGGEGGGQVGCVTKDDVIHKLRWSDERAERAISLLLQEGMAWKDDYHGISFYWFPSVWKEGAQFQ